MPDPANFATVSISQLDVIAVNERVTFKSIKVLNLAEVESIRTRDGKQLKKQDCTIADEETTCR